MDIKTVDMRGQVCPATLINALREINCCKSQLRSGNFKLIFLTTNRDSTVTIPETAKSMGYSVSVSENDGGYIIEVHAIYN